MKEHRKAIIILFVTLFLVMVGFGIIIPILPFYVRHYGGDARTLGLLLASYSIMQFFFAPIWGRLSDRIGRRPVLLIGLSGYILTFTLYGLSTHLWMLFAARILAGMISSATLPTAMAYMADVSSNMDRAKAMGMMGGAMGLGIITGPALGGFLGTYGLSIPFFTAAGLAALTLPFAAVMLPESNLDRSAAIARPVRRFSRDLLHHPQLMLFLLALVISFSMSMFESTVALFSADRVGFGPRDMGIMFGVLGIVGVFLQAGMLGRIVNRVGDVPVIVAGLVISAIGFALLPGVHSVPFFWACAGVFSVGSAILRPGVSTLVTKTSTGGQGASIGVMQSFDSLGRILGPIAGGTVYELNNGYPYVLGALVFAAVLTLGWRRLNAFNYLHREAQAKQAAG